MDLSVCITTIPLETKNPPKKMAPFLARIRRHSDEVEILSSKAVKEEKELNEQKKGIGTESNLAD